MNSSTTANDVEQLRLGLLGPTASRVGPLRLRSRDRRPIADRQRRGLGHAEHFFDTTDTRLALCVKRTHGLLHTPDGGHGRDPVFGVFQEYCQRLERVLFIESNEERLLAHGVLELDERLARVFVRLVIDLLERAEAAFFGRRLALVNVRADPHERFERAALDFARLERLDFCRHERTPLGFVAACGGAVPGDP